MGEKVDFVLKPIGKLLATRHYGVETKSLPPDWAALLDEWREREQSARQEKAEDSAPRPIATDDAPGG